MNPNDLKDKSIDVLTSQLHLSIDNNAYLQTILDILIETNHLDKDKIMEKLSQNRDRALDLLSTSDKA